jgi:predicted MFS family arabinose efflux permease
LLLAAAIVLAALVPAWRFRPALAAPAEPGRIWPRGPFLKRYLAAYGLWQLATGSFNPFANVFFARLGFSAARIGSLFSATQITQLGAVLLAPAIIRRAGLLRAIVGMMAASAFGLCGMSAGAAPVVAYAWYMSLQWMSEPGMNTLLMNNVKEPERSGASSLNYLVSFAAQAVAAYTAGHLLTKAGYAPVLAVAGVLALAAAVMFGILLRSKNPAPLPAISPK